MSVSNPPDALAAVVALLKVAGAVPTRCTGGIWGTFGEGFENASPAVVVSLEGGTELEEAPVAQAVIKLYCLGGANDKGPGAAETHRIVAGRLRAVRNEITASGRVLDCVMASGMQLIEDEKTLWMMAVSEWQVLVAPLS